MQGFVGGVFVLGLAGFDPITAILALAALAGGASRRGILVYAAIALLVPTAMGIALSLILGATRVGVSATSVDWDSPWLAVIQGSVAVLMVAWAARRWSNRGSKEVRKTRGTSIRSLATLGLALGSAFILDPIYLALVVFVGRASVGEIIGAHVAWTLMSQSLLVVIAVAVATGRDQPVTLFLNRIVTRFSSTLHLALTSLIAIAGLLMGADVMTYVITGGTYLLH